MAKRGGARPGAGRPKGGRDLASGEQRAALEELARSHTETAINVLVEIATTGTSESARVSAAGVILDRGYGKAPQHIDANINARVAFEDMIAAAHKYDEEQQRRAEREPDTE